MMPKSQNYLRIHFVFSWIILVPFHVHTNSGTTTSCPTEAENDAGAVLKDQTNTLQQNQIQLYESDALI